MNDNKYNRKFLMKHGLILLIILFVAGTNGCESCMGNGSVGSNANTTGLDTVSPTVSLTTPAQGDTDVLINRIITVSFSEEMDPATVNDTSFIVTKADGTPVLGFVDLDDTGRVATFRPDANFEISTAYTATVATGVEDLAGNALSNNYVWEFTTGALSDATSPTVILTNPLDGTTNVAINRAVVAIFSEAIDPLTLSHATFLITGAESTAVSGLLFLDITNRIVSFIPTDDLTTNTLYTATLTSVITDLAGNSLASSYIWEFTTGTSNDTTAPAVSITSPLDTETDVAINQVVVVTFDESMEPLSISTLSLLLTDSTSTPVSGTVVLDTTSRIATFVPDSDLAINTTYTATVTTDATDLALNGLTSDYIWEFTTGDMSDTTAPTVLLTNPDDAEIDVATNQAVVATFSEDMKPLTMTNTSFLLVNSDGASIVGSVTYDLVGNTVTFTPDSELAISTTYTATITTDVQDLASNPLALDYEWSFTTGALTDLIAPEVNFTNPEDGDESVALNKIITATFSETMNTSTITTANYLLTGPGTTPVSGSVFYDLLTDIAEFTPNTELLPNTLYTVTLTAIAADLANNPLGSNYVWSFMTGSEAAQTVAQDVVPLGSSSNFVILASAAITNIATSMITGDIGLTPDAGSNISGFSVPATCPEITGDMYVVDATGPACAIISPTILTDAKTDAEIAFINARDAVRGTPQAISGNINGLTLYPGLYESGSSLEISPGGFLYLDAQGDSSAVFIIRSATSITTEATSEVVLTKGALAANVYWTAGSAVTLGTNSIMKGTMIAGTSISLLTGANIEGRLLNQGAAAEAITLDSSTVTLPTP